MADSEGFEPPELCSSTVFKTAAFDLSANYPFNGPVHVQERLADLRHTCCNVGTMFRHRIEQSEPTGATRKLLPKSQRLQRPRKSGYLQLSPNVQKCYNPYTGLLADWATRT